MAAFQTGGQRDRALAGAAQDATVTDTFSLKGFTAAYAAINKACPAK